MAFSTLGCPDWSFAKIVEFAVAHGFRGLEMRGLNRQMDLTLCPEFNSPESIRNTLSIMKDHRLEFVNLGASANMHIDEVVHRKKQIDEGKRFIDLAAKLGCPFIRVFPNRLPPEKEKSYSIDLIASGLRELGDHAKGSTVTVLMETHGDVVKVEDIVQVMERCNHEKVALIWDIVNMWSVTKEPPADAFRALKKYIRHTHIKDAVVADAKLSYVFVGQGNTPVLEAVDILSRDNYPGYYSFEWEKLWHPEIAEPEPAFAEYAATMKKRLA